MNTDNTNNELINTEEVSKTDETTIKTSSTTKTQLPLCGVVMPIAAMTDYPESHWKDILNIIREASAIAGYRAQLVSDSESVGVIHRDIVQNLYQNEIIVCDVSGKNPNVMFELGMRLTFDKPTVIIKDNITNYSFDIGNIRHEEYPRDLRYNSIQEFKKRLAIRITETVNAYKNPDYTTFLKHFKNLQIKPAELESKEIGLNELVLNRLDNILARVSRIENKYEETYSSNNKSEEVSAASVFRHFLLRSFFKEYIESLSHEQFKKFISLKTLDERIAPFINYVKEKDVQFYKEIRSKDIQDVLDIYANIEEDVISQRLF